MNKFHQDEHHKHKDLWVRHVYKIYYWKFTVYVRHMVDVLPLAYSLAHTYFFCGKHVAFILDDLLGSGLPK